MAVSLETPPEPWLRGPIEGLHPVISHLLRASQQIREDIELALRPLTVSQLWVTPEDLNPAGFHATHLAGSIDRLCTYLEGRALSPDQIRAIPLERVGTATAAMLLENISAQLDRYERLVRNLDPAEFASPRYVGRARYATTAISLAIHIAEHGQRHVGQAISASQLARALG
jgi:hypothetical protein